MTADPVDVFVADTRSETAPADDAAIAAASQRLRFTLPDSYLGLLRFQNGGRLRRTRFDTDFETSWSSDHFVVEALLGVGDAWMALDGEAGSDYMVQEWGYPDLGLVVGVTPSGGHDTVMLDYRDCGPDGDPRVAYIDEDREPRVVANSLTEFLEKLQPK